MKKFLTLLLVAVMCLSLVACGGGNDTPSTNDGGDDIDSGKTHTAVVVIRINPEFQLYLNNEGIVLALDCLNDDANSIAGKVNVIGKPCEDVLTSIFKEASNAGFLPDGGAVALTVLVEGTTPAQLAEWNDTVLDNATKALDRLDINAALSIDTMETGSAQNTSQEGNSLDRNDGYLKYTDPQGNVVETAFHPNGVMKWEKVTAPDGHWREDTYHTDGSLLRSVSQSADGIVGSEIDYHAGGIIAYEKRYDSRGTYRECTYTSQGELLTENYLTDRNLIKIIYEPAGVMKYKHFYTFDGAFSMTFLYDSSGNQLDILDENGKSLGLTLNGQGAGQ